MSSSSSSDRDPSKAARLPDDLGGAAALLGIDLVEKGPERVVATLPVAEKHHQPFGVLHGGVSVVLAETVASVGAFLAAPAGRVPMGIEVNANHVRPVRTGSLRAVGTPLHTGRTTHVWDVKLHKEDALVCVSRCTLALVDDPDRSPS